MWAIRMDFDTIKYILKFKLFLRFKSLLVKMILSIYYITLYMFLNIYLIIILEFLFILIVIPLLFSPLLVPLVMDTTIHFTGCYVSLILHTIQPVVYYSLFVLFSMIFFLSSYLYFLLLIFTYLLSKSRQWLKWQKCTLPSWPSLK